VISLERVMKKILMKNIKKVAASDYQRLPGVYLGKLDDINI